MTLEFDVEKGEIISSDREEENPRQEIGPENYKGFERVLYYIADFALSVRKKIKDSQPEWYQALGTW